MSNDDKSELLKKETGISTAVEEPGEEAAHLDDKVIGRAFRGSVIALLLLGTAAGAAIWYANRKPPQQAARMTQITAPVNPARPQAEIPVMQFKDITAEAGIKFVHHNGAYGDKLLPETMGSGVAFFDFDGDGDQDLLLVNSADWPWKKKDANPPTMALYRNDGKGQFEDVTAASGLDISIYGMGVAIGDFDNDGKPDVLIT